MNQYPLRNQDKLAAVMLIAAICGLPQTVSAQGQLTPQTRAQIRAFLQSCRSDIRQYCQGVQPGQGRIFFCLQDNYNQVLPACQQALDNPPEISGQVSPSTNGG